MFFILSHFMSVRWRFPEATPRDDLITMEYVLLGYKSFTVLISYRVNVKRYNPHKQKLFGILNYFKSVKRSKDCEPVSE